MSVAVSVGNPMAGSMIDDVPPATVQQRRVFVLKGYAKRMETKAWWGAAMSFFAGLGTVLCMWAYSMYMFGTNGLLDEKMKSGMLAAEYLGGRGPTINAVKLMVGVDLAIFTRELLWEAAHYRAKISLSQPGGLTWTEWSKFLNTFCVKYVSASVIGAVLSMAAFAGIAHLLIWLSMDIVRSLTYYSYEYLWYVFAPLIGTVVLSAVLVHRAFRDRTGVVML
jgi:hypothetical protein